MVNDKTDKGLDFTVEIEKFYDDFPEYRDTVFIVNPDKHDSIEDFLADNPKFSQILDEYQAIGFDVKEENYFYNNGSFCHDLFDKVNFTEKLQQNLSIDFVSLVMVQRKIKYNKSRLLNSFNKNAFKDSYSKEIEQKSSLYHELGHAIYNHRNTDRITDYCFRETDKQFAYETEAAAESYSLIRLVQEYGINHPDIERIFAERTLDRLKEPESRYNFLPAMHEVARLAKIGKLDNLTTRQSADLAEKIAKENVINPKKSKKVSRFLGSAYDSLSSNKNIANSVHNFSASVANIKEPVVLNDAQYILQCLEDVTSNNPHIQKQVKRMWDALKRNDVVQEKGLLQQHWRATKLKASPRKTIAMRLKGLF